MINSSMISPTGAQVHVLENQTAWINTLAQRLTDCAQKAIASRGLFSLCLTGGTTPGPLYETLGREPWRTALDWSRVQIFFGDERAVGPDHPDSNFRMAYETWLNRSPIPAESIFRMEGEADSNAEGLANAAKRYSAIMRRHLPVAKNGFPSLDLLLLGMGGDGHTASLFPGTAALTERISPVVANEVPQLNTWRLTLTLPALGAAHNVWFLVTGKDKAERVAQVLGYREGGRALPAACVRTAQPAHWWLDRAASESIPIA